MHVMTIFMQFLPSGVYFYTALSLAYLRSSSQNRHAEESVLTKYKLLSQSDNHSIVSDSFCGVCTVIPFHIPSVDFFVVEFLWCYANMSFELDSSAIRSAAILDNTRAVSHTSKQTNRLPRTSSGRLARSKGETPVTLPELLPSSSNVSHHDTVLYLAYGSNLSAETFKGKRGIKPLSAINVLVPSLALAFDLPGIPYIEPCFANSKHRPENELPTTSDYHKDRWHKGLVGVVYEVTRADFAIIIATEGGGASYKDITVQCYELPEGTKIVDPEPKSKPFIAHTLFSPQYHGDESTKRSGRLTRPDPSYAQASARYLKLITDGAEEHDLPGEYRDYLYALRPYTITSKRQRAGQMLMTTFWLPFIFAIFALGKTLADKHGRIPEWLANLTNLCFLAVWATYDAAFIIVFGDGERTEKRREKDEETGENEKSPLLNEKCDRPEFGVREN